MKYLDDNKRFETLLVPDGVLGIRDLVLHWAVREPALGGGGESAQEVGAREMGQVNRLLLSGLPLALSLL